MSHYTMTLKRVIKLTGGLDYTGVSFRSDEDKTRINSLIVGEYYLREIAHETIDMFLYRFRQTMIQIMPEFNMRYSLVEKIGDVELWTTKTVTSQQGNSLTNTRSKAVTDSTGLTKSRTVESDTPQHILAGDADYAKGLVDNQSDNSSASTATESNDGTTQTKSSGEIVGYDDNPLVISSRVQELIYNIDIALLERLEHLFLGVFNSPSSYS